MPWSDFPSLRKFDLLTGGESNDCFLPVGAAAEIGSAFPLFLTRILAGVDAHHPLSKKLFDRLLNLQFVCARIDPENVLIMFFTQQTGLFRKPNIANQMRRFVHANLSANLANASLVTIIFWKARSCSVFTSDAVCNCTGRTFLAAL